MKADDLIRELAERYAAISTYRDSGVVLQPLRDGEPPIETQFETRFQRPHLFRFAFSSPHPFPPLAHIVTRHCSGADTSGAYVWMKHHDDPAQVREEEDLSMAIAGATGISGGSAHTIGALLMPDIGGFTLDQVREPQISGEAMVEDALCVVIDASRRGGSVALWLHRDSMTLRKMVTRHEGFPPGEEIRRDIQIDGQIEPGELRRPCET